MQQQEDNQNHKTNYKIHMDEWLTYEFGMWETSQWLSDILVDTWQAHNWHMTSSRLICDGCVMDIWEVHEWLNWQMIDNFLPNMNKGAECLN